MVTDEDVVAEVVVRRDVEILVLLVVLRQVGDTGNHREAGGEV